MASYNDIPARKRFINLYTPNFEETNWSYSIRYAIVKPLLGTHNPYDFLQVARVDERTNSEVMVLEARSIGRMFISVTLPAIMDLLRRFM
jgi:hypothetical protein